MIRLEDLALIGNCQFSALVERSGSIVWSCLPCFDAEPVFGALLDANEGGQFRVGPVDGSFGTSRYLGNTNVLETRFESEDGAFRVVDFAPRFMLHDRSFRPTKIVRIVEPLSGAPRICATCKPVLGWTKAPPRELHGSNHISYLGYKAELRLTTDIPLSYLTGAPFALTERRHLVLAWGEPVEEPLPALCERFLSQTLHYWTIWVKHCAVPPHYQAEVIRSALALKLHCYEDTGAIIAASTTSIPESNGSGRTWDYRYCWLRDAYYALGAFRLLGHFEEREQFLVYLLNVSANSPELDLAPLYRINGGSDLAERVLPHWAGFNGDGPVRVGNGAALQRQNDIYGELVLALAPIFMDDRFRAERSEATFSLVRRLAVKAVSVVGQPEAGIWELRGEWRPQTFTTLMCWAAADRMARICEAHAPQLESEFRAHAVRIASQVWTDGWNPTKRSLAGATGGADLDASVLQAITLRLAPAADPRLHTTLDAIVRELGQDGWLFRYRNDDGLGVPEVAFVVCSFWLVEALARLGRVEEARRAFAHARSALGPVGLIAEDIDPRSGLMSGNFPQAYSHVGLIHAAFAASPSWSDVT